MNKPVMMFSAKNSENRTIVLYFFRASEQTPLPLSKRRTMALILAWVLDHIRAPVKRTFGLG